MASSIEEIKQEDPPPAHPQILLDAWGQPIPTLLRDHLLAAEAPEAAYQQFLKQQQETRAARREQRRQGYLRRMLDPTHTYRR